jgi:hypothetical protein
MHARSILFALMMLALSALTGCAGSQRSFASPEEAVGALERAVGEVDRPELRRIFGPRSEELKSGDAEQDRGDFVAFASKIKERALIEQVNADEVSLVVGEEAWPFPVPIVRSGGRWRFDTEMGITEVTSRRIGANELAVIAACWALIGAEVQYQAVDRNGDGVNEFTTRLMSTPGTRDGLYWEVGEGEEPSPIGPVMAMAMVGADPSEEAFPFYGYYFKVLTRQGPAAPGGAMEYVENGRLTKGIAAVAFPAEHGQTGIMTVILSMDGVLYQRDLGPDTRSIVAAMDAFDPGEGWTRVSE